MDPKRDDVVTSLYRYVMAQIVKKDWTTVCTVQDALLVSDGLSPSMPLVLGVRRNIGHWASNLFHRSCAAIHPCENHC